MKTRLIRVSIIIVTLLILATMALSFQNINIEGRFLPTLQRGSENVLGLKLGLDLEGGAHLVYQADYGTTIYIKTTTAVKPEVVAQLIEQSKAEIIEVLSNEENTEFYIKTVNLSEDIKAAVMNIKEQGLLINTEIELDMKDVPKPTEAQMTGAVDTVLRRVNLYGTDEPIVQQYGDDRILVQLPGIGGSRTTFSFKEPQDLEISQLDTFISTLFVRSRPSIELSSPNTYLLKSASFTQEMVD